MDTFKEYIDRNLHKKYKVEPPEPAKYFFSECNIEMGGYRIPKGTMFILIGNKMIIEDKQTRLELDVRTIDSGLMAYLKRI